MTSEEPSRELGVEFGPAEAEIEAVDYPQETAALVKDLGDHEITLQDGTERLGDILEVAGDRTYESPGEVRQAVIGTVSDDAIGRKQYDDRGGVTGDQQRSDESI